MLKLLSLNIEGDNHLDAVVKLVRDESPDLICFNEVFEVDVPLLKHSFNMEGVFLPSVAVLEPINNISPKGNMGSLVLSKYPILSSRVDYYDGSKDVLRKLSSSENNAPSRFLIWVEVEKENHAYSVVNTHFTITDEGRPSDLQRANMKKVLALLQGKEFVLCGDFNAPRGGEIFDMLASKYQDCIPEDVKTTLDRSLHRSGGKADFPDFVIDGLFSTAAYVAHDVRVVCGVSDHCAILSQIEAVSG